MYNTLPLCSGSIRYDVADEGEGQMGLFKAMGIPGGRKRKLSSSPTLVTRD